MKKHKLSKNEVIYYVTLVITTILIIFGLIFGLMNI